MNTLLLWLSGPMQAWGAQSRFTVRDSGLEPSKSGVVGLLAASLGRSREEPLDDLAALRMGVRVDREGHLERDYHTALGVVKADGKVPPRHDHPKFTVVSERFYLADAKFLVGFEGEDLPLLRRLHGALAEPRWPLFLGRKAFPPSEGVFLPDGLRAGEGLEDALGRYPWLGTAPEGVERLRTVTEEPSARGGETRMDQPSGASFATRRFIPRNVKTGFVPIPQEATP